MPNAAGVIKRDQSRRIYDINGKGRTILAHGSGGNSDTSAPATGLYAVSVYKGNARPIYEVRDGMITIKDKQYPIKLADGCYIIRKLTITECCRLQTLPDDYCRAVSPTQGYKGLGNGWTAEVIIHIMRTALAGVPRTEKNTSAVYVRRYRHRTILPQGIRL